MWSKTVIAVVVVLVIIALGLLAWKWEQGRRQSFFGWRHQQYEDNPYSGQKYHCGLGALGWAYPPDWLKKAQCSRSGPRKDGFAADQGHWPDAGVYGNLADTNPYGNYADSQQELWPTYSTPRETRYWSAF